MSNQRSFRFGVSVHGSQSRTEWRDIARQAEALGYSTLLIPDHLGDQLSPIPALVAAAEATSTLRMGSLADLELGILVAQVFTTEDCEQAAHLIATTLAAGYNVSTDQILQAPYLLIGSIDQICEDLLARRE